MNILDLRRVEPIYPSKRLDLRKPRENNNNNQNLNSGNNNNKPNDFRSIMQNEIDKLV